MNFIIFLLSSYGLTQILVYGKIFEKVREKINLYLTKCPMCMGTYVGFLNFILFWISGIKLFPNFIVGILLFGWISSGVSYVLCNLFDDNGIKITNLHL